MRDIRVVVIARLIELKMLAEAATSGPWVTPGPDTIGEWMVYGEKWAVADAVVPPALRDGITGAQANINAAYIATWNPKFSLGWITLALKAAEQHYPCTYDDWPYTPEHKTCDSCEEYWPCTTYKDMMELLSIEDGE